MFLVDTSLALLGTWQIEHFPHFCCACQVQDSKAFDAIKTTCAADPVGCDQALKETVLPDLLRLQSTAHQDAMAEVRRIDHVLLLV